MKSGICNLSLVAVRRAPGHSSEIVTQLLFGESFEIIETDNNWVQIKTHYDNYIGWIHHLQFFTFDDIGFDEFKKAAKVLISNSSSCLTELTSQKNIHLLLGSTILLPTDDTFRIGNLSFQFKGDFFTPVVNKNEIINNAMQFLNSPYLWGGRTQFGIDCSGFTQMVYKLSGVFLPRDASQQSEIGESLSFVSEAEPGDLVFFDNENGNISHVGILFDHNHIIHASGCVRIDLLDHNGIFNKDIGKYTHSLRLVKKII